MSKALVRVAVPFALLAGTILAGDDADREHQLRLAKLRFDLAVEVLEYAEGAVREHRAAFESSGISEAQFHEVLLERDEARSERDRLAIDLEEVRATGREAQQGIAAPLVGGKDLVMARLAISLELAQRRLRMAERRAAEAKRRFEAQAGTAGELLTTTSEVEAARAEHEAFEALLRIRRAFVAGEVPEATADLQAAIAEVTAEATEARSHSQVESEGLREMRALFEVGRVTKAELREAQVEAARTAADYEIARLELERLKGKGAPRDSTELVFRIEMEGDDRDKVLDVIRERLARSGFEDVALGLVGEDRFSVRVRGASREKLDWIRALVTALGKLEFRITVEPDASDHHAHYWKLFQEARKKGVHHEIASFIGPDDVHEDDRARFPDGLRWYPADGDRIPKERLARDESGEPRPWVLCALDNHNVTGEHLYNVFHARDQVDLGEGWAIYFKIKKVAVERMSKLTSYEEDKYMAIIVNGRVHAAPILQSTLSDSGQITGGYTEETARLLAAVLQAGALEHKPDLVSESTTTADGKKQD
jgi:hypothetical protein